MKKQSFFITLSQVGPIKRAFVGLFIYLFIRNSYCASHAEGFNVHLAEISSEPTAKIFEELQILNL